MTGADYERELKGILSGDQSTLMATTRRFTLEERAGYFLTTKRHVLVVRGAGSLGFDLVALRGTWAFPIEVKSSLVERIGFSENARVTEQIAAYRRECAAADVLPLYAFRLKRANGDPWRLFAGLYAADPIPTEGLGRLLVTTGKVPKVETTERGNSLLNWNKGLPLHRFLHYLLDRDG